MDQKNIKYKLKIHTKNSVLLIFLTIGNKIGIGSSFQASHF